jgi:hypothetical protein
MLEFFPPRLSACVYYNLYAKFLVYIVNNNYFSQSSPNTSFISMTLSIICAKTLALRGFYLASLWLASVGWGKAGNTKGGSITVPLTSCLTGLNQPVLQIKTKNISIHTADSKPVKQEVNGTVILPPLVFPDM